MYKKEKYGNSTTGDNMKKLVVVVPILFIIFLCFRPQKQEEIRIRVIANSNSEQDQHYKAQVVEYLKHYFQENFNSYHEADQYIKNKMEDLEKKLNQKFNQIHMSYENHNFYDKTYNGIVEENQNYKTLLIQIGSAEGDNWWGSLYPNNQKESTEKVHYKWFFMEWFEKGEKNVRN